MPAVAPYPVNVKYNPFGDLVIKPSEVAEPLEEITLLLPEVDVGNATDCIKVPEPSYSSKKIALAALVKAAEPVPTL